MRQLYFPLQYKLSPGLTKSRTWTAERANRYLSFKADPEHFHQHWLTYNFRSLEGIGNEVDGRKVCKSTKYRDGWHFRRARSNLWTWQSWAFIRVPKGSGLPAPSPLSYTFSGPMLACLGVHVTVMWKNDPPCVHECTPKCWGSGEWLRRFFQYQNSGSAFLAMSSFGT